MIGSFLRWLWVVTTWDTFCAMTRAKAEGVARARLRKYDLERLAGAPHALVRVKERWARREEQLVAERRGLLRSVGR